MMAPADNNVPVASSTNEKLWLWLLDELRLVMRGRWVDRYGGDGMGRGM